MVDVLSNENALAILNSGNVDRIGVYRPIDDFSEWRFVTYAGNQLIKETSIRVDFFNRTEFEAFKQLIANELRANWQPVDLPFPYLHYQEWVRNG